MVRDYGRGIPLGKVVDVVSKINTGAKYDSGAFQKSVGLNGVGTKAVNALSNYFKVQAFRDGKTKLAEFKKGILTPDAKKPRPMKKTEHWWNSNRTIPCSNIITSSRSTWMT